MAKYRAKKAKYCELVKEAKYCRVCAKYCASVSVYKLLTCCVSEGSGGHVTMQEGGHPHWRPPGKKLGNKMV